MAYTPRTISEIKQTILDAKAQQSALSGLNSTSATSLYGSFAYICAVGTSLLEQLFPFFQSEIETIVSTAPVGSEPWVRQKAIEFQYGDVLTLVDFAPMYDPVDVTKRIVTRCAVRTGSNGVVQIKVAKQEPPVALAGGELTALQDYFTKGGDGTYAGRSVALGFAGVTYQVISLDADKLYLAGTIYVNGQYAATVQQGVIDAINTYMASLPFTGEVTLLGITDAIQAVPGVADIKLSDVAIRADITAFANKTYMRQAQADIIISYPTYAGYIVEEDTVGETFTDRLLFAVL